MTQQVKGLEISAATLRGIAGGLIVYGGVGILLVAAALVGASTGSSKIDAALGSAAEASATLGAIADAFESFDDSFATAARSASDAAVASRDATSTSARLADAMTLNIFGIQPLLPLANDFRRQSEQFAAIADDLEQLGGALSKNRAELAPIRDHVHLLSVRVGAVSGGNAGITGLTSLLIAILVWLGTQAATALLVGLLLWRRLRQGSFSRQAEKVGRT